MFALAYRYIVYIFLTFFASSEAFPLLGVTFPQFYRGNLPLWKTLPLFVIILRTTHLMLVENSSLLL